LVTREPKIFSSALDAGATAMAVSPIAMQMEDNVFMRVLEIAIE
jgi:hypothetical protein